MKEEYDTDRAKKFIGKIVDVDKYGIGVIESLVIDDDGKLFGVVAQCGEKLIGLKFCNGEIVRLQ